MSLVRTGKHFTLLLGLALMISAPSAFAQDDAPPEIPGNPGVPGLLAEITVLETDLAATQAELAVTKADLAATQATLLATQTILTQTQNTLNITNALLDEKLDELAREKNRYRVPQTGQTECWDALNEDPDEPHFINNCAMSRGQDGDNQAGLAPPVNRFIDNGDGTVTDTFTDLVWLTNADCAPDLSWEEAVALGRRLSGSPPMSLCGLLDGTAQGVWRLPNVHELTSLLDYGHSSNGTLPDSHPFTGFGRWYWTSTTFALDPLFGVSGLLHNVCGTRGYGQDNRQRFNDAYIVSMVSGDVIRTPKEDRDTISRKHKQGIRDFQLDLCHDNGFKNGSPDPLPPANFIAVRDPINQP